MSSPGFPQAPFPHSQAGKEADMRQSTPPHQSVASGRPRKQAPPSPRELREGLVQAGDVGGLFDWITLSAWDLIDVKEGFDQLRRAVDVASRRDPAGFTSDVFRDMTGFSVYLVKRVQYLILRGLERRD